MLIRRVVACRSSKQQSHLVIFLQPLNIALVIRKDTREKVCKKRQNLGKKRREAHSKKELFCLSQHHHHQHTHILTTREKSITRFTLLCFSVLRPPLPWKLQQHTTRESEIAVFPSVISGDNHTTDTTIDSL